MRATVVTQADIELLEQLFVRAKDDVDQCVVDLETAKRRHAQAVERLAHIQALLTLERKAQPVASHDSGHSVATGPANGDRQAVDMVATVLAERDAPMHYREIYGELERRGILIKGASPANTLLTRMLRDGRFKPAGQRGSYVLDPTSEHKHFRPERRMSN